MEKSNQCYAKELLEFIHCSPSSFHVVANLAKMLTEAGFTHLEEQSAWQIQPGGRYYITRNGSAIMAFVVPLLEMTNFQITASHSDSPSFKIKEKAEMVVDGHYVELNAEGYGGMLCAPWFDRPLSIAGRVVVQTEQGIQSRLVDFDRDVVMIPNVAIHMNRQANDGYTYNKQKDMIPLFGEASAAGQFDAMVAELAGVAQEQVLGKDLYLYNRVPGTIWGASEEYLSSGCLDDLECAYATMQALINSLDTQQEHGLRVCCVFDNEEVGSSTKQGADSTMLYDTLHRICIGLGYNQEQYYQCVASSFMLSADNAQAVHPHHMDKADPTNRVYMNEGVVIKHSANQKYTTDAISAAVFKEICEQAQVPVQAYVNRSDVPGGSTLGNLANHHVALDTVDIGLAQLAMHSPYETAGVRDVEYLLRAVEMFYRREVRKMGDGEFRIQ